jgi:hypothetical protein
VSADDDRCPDCGHPPGCACWPCCDLDNDPDDDRCLSCGGVMDHFLGCPDDPDPDYEAEQEARRGV